MISVVAVTTGLSLSTTVIVVVHVTSGLIPSVAVQVTIVSPSGSTSPAIVAVLFKSLVMLTLQLSVAVASNSVPCTVYSQTPESVFLVSLATQVITGAILSITLTVIGNALFTVLPFTSLILICRLFIPISAQVKVLFARPP